MSRWHPFQWIFPCGMLCVIACLCCECSGSEVRSSAPPAPNGATKAPESSLPSAQDPVVIIDQLLEKKDRMGILAFGNTVGLIDEQTRVAVSMQGWCQSFGCDLAVSTGGNFINGVGSASDPLFKEKFEDIYARFVIPFYMALGNQDYLGDTSAQIAYTQSSKIWKMPARHYLVRTGSFLDVVVIDSNPADLSDENVWLSKALGLSTATWKLVVGHHPAHSNGKHGTQNKVVQQILPVICSSATLYVAGYEYNQQVVRESCGKTVVIAGAGSMAEEVEAGGLVSFATKSLGFSWIQAEKTKLTVTMIDTNQKALYSFEVIPTSQ